MGKEYNNRWNAPLVNKGFTLAEYETNTIEWETGANNWQTNEVILTMVNDSRMYNQLKGNVNAFYVFVDYRIDFVGISDQDLDYINWGFVNQYFREYFTAHIA